mgnify:CR=1 FL=1
MKLNENHKRKKNRTEQHDSKKKWKRWEYLEDLAAKIAGQQ